MAQRFSEESAVEERVKAAKRSVYPVGRRDEEVVRAVEAKP